MDKQIIISIGREHGSAGHKIAEEIAKKLNIALYDRNLLEELTHTKDFEISNYEKFDEKPRNFFLSRTVKGHSNSPEENVAQLQFDLLKSKAEKGESFVVVGRCSEHILKDYPLVSIFIHSENIEDKIKYLMSCKERSREETIKSIERHDKKRATYYKHFTGKKWGSSESYDLCINVSTLGIEGTTEFLLDFIAKFKNK